MGSTPKARGKCFTGCWTCRSRRVKCDQGTPVCQRCRHLGIQCEGYGIRLHWVNPDEASSGLEDERRSPRYRASRSSLAGPSFAHVPRLVSPEIENALDRIDNWRDQQSQELSISGFSVFSLKPLVDSAEVTTAHNSPVELPCGPPLGLVPHLQRDLVTGTANPSSSDPEHQTPIDTRSWTRATDHGDQACTLGSEGRSRAAGDPTQDIDGTAPDQQVVHDNISTTETRPGLPKGVRDEDNTGTRASQGPARHIDALTMPSKQKRLIHHWVTFTSRKLVLLDEPQNPCRTMMLPMALKGLVSGSNSSNADVAIFHAICASAAYNLYELGGQSCEQDHVLALNHDHQAIYHLRQNLAETDAHRAQSVAMAIMACIAVEAISGTTQRWRTHVSGALAYLTRLYSQCVDERSLSAFRHHLVKMAILCDVTVPGNLNSFLDDESDATVGLEFTFPYYGVSRSFLRRQDCINSLVTTSSRSDEEANAFELQLYLDFPSISPPGSASASNEMHGLVIHHAAKAFYYAQLVYFQRSLRGASVSAVQDLVDLGVAELESIERHAGHGELGCVMLWPALILGSESGTSSNQMRVRSWFRSQRRLGFRNLVILEDLITAVWKARSHSDADGQDTDWQKVAAQNPARFDVFRL